MARRRWKPGKKAGRRVAVLKTIHCRKCDRTTVHWAKTDGGALKCSVCHPRASRRPTQGDDQP